MGDTPANYGSNNVDIRMEGNDLVIRLNTKTILHKAGTLKADGKERKMNLVATTGGFQNCGQVRVSLNVTSDPA